MTPTFHWPELSDMGTILGQEDQPCVLAAEENGLVNSSLISVF